jgi:hypothetical protein
VALIRAKELQKGHTPVPEEEDEEADGEVHCVEVDQDIDQSPEESNASFAIEGKHRFIILTCL